MRSKKTCVVCGKEMLEKDTSCLAITYLTDGSQYMTLNTYCRECDNKIVYPTIKKISDDLELQFRGRKEQNDGEQEAEHGNI